MEIWSFLHFVDLGLILHLNFRLEGWLFYFVSWPTANPISNINSRALLILRWFSCKGWWLSKKIVCIWSKCIMEEIFMQRMMAFQENFVCNWSKCIMEDHWFKYENWLWNLKAIAKIPRSRKRKFKIQNQGVTAEIFSYHMSFRIQPCFEFWISD